ncbi:MAG: UTP--glucose-1-phosphate uridylyltransferase, partial [Planctomycetota bacterium]
MYVMTSPPTHDETTTFLQQHQFFGMDPDHVKIFCQGTMPAVDASTGKVLLADKSKLALSPDGHGGTLAAMHNSGTLQHAIDRGVQYVAYAQVDNPLVQLADPALLGHHIQSGSEMTTQVVRKRYPSERVGNVVEIDGRVQIIEYSDLPDNAAQATNDDGSLKLWAGNIAVHMLDVAFIQRSISNTDALPFHRASKKVPFIDSEGMLVTPDEPNATKFERFIFDLLPSAKDAFVVEGRVQEVFAPVKNADGAENDTPSHAAAAISDLHRQWLVDAGVEVADNVTVEIAPHVALDAAQAKRTLAGHVAIRDNTFLQ